MTDNDLSTQTARAFKAIVRFIQARQLREGDRLPPQEELRRIMGYSNDTLTAAMNRLVAEGVLTRKRRVGTVIVKPAGPDRIAWSIGIATRGVTADDHNAFRAEVAHRLVSYLLQEGCSCRLYHRTQLPDDAPLPPALDNFHGLRADVEAGRLDAVIFNAVVKEGVIGELATRGIEAIKVSRMGPASQGVMVDEGAGIDTGVEHLITHGAQRVMVVSSSLMDRWHPSVTPALEQTRARFAGKVSAFELIEGCMGLEPGKALADALLTRSEGSRPDGLVFTDDFAALSFTETLLTIPDYRPQIVVMTTRQLPMYFPLPVTRLEMDLDQLTVRGVQMILARLRNPSLESKIEWVKRSLIAPHPLATGANAQASTTAVPAK